MVDAQKQFMLKLKFVVYTGGSIRADATPMRGIMVRLLKRGSVKGH